MLRKKNPRNEFSSMIPYSSFRQFNRRFIIDGNIFTGFLFSNMSGDFGKLLICFIFDGRSISDSFSSNISDFGKSSNALTIKKDSKYSALSPNVREANVHKSVSKLLIDRLENYSNRKI